MDNAQKAIMIGVGLFITIIIISAVLLITNIGTNMINSSREQLSSITGALQNQVTSAYDGKTMNGSEVISAWTLYENSEMSVVLAIPTSGGYTYATSGKYALDTAKITGVSNTAPVPGGVEYSGDYVAHTAKTTLTQLQATTGGYGVTASHSYYSSVIKDSVTNTVVGILFVQAK